MTRKMSQCFSRVTMSELHPTTVRSLKIKNRREYSSKPNFSLSHRVKLVIQIWVNFTFLLKSIDCMRCRYSLLVTKQLL